jgi:hypothetical protein
MPTVRHLGRCAIVALLMLMLMKSQLVLAETVLDSFETLDGWTAIGTDGAQVELARDAGVSGQAMRIDYRFPSGGHVLVRKAFALDLPPNYAFTLYTRAVGPPVDFEFKLIDKTDRNVWWYRERDVTLPETWRALRIKKPRIEFAWGPLSGGAPRDIAAIEFAVTAAMGESGSVWIDELGLQTRVLPTRTPGPVHVTASTSAVGETPERVLDADPYTRWRSGTLGPDQWLMLDFGQVREYGGLVIDWDPDDYAVAYEVLTSEDGARWTSAYRSTRGNGGRDYVYLPDGESRYLRLLLQESSRDQGYAIRRISLLPLELAASPNTFFTNMAREAPAGTYPKYFGGVQSYWTVLGADGDTKDAAMNEEGMLEVDRGAFSLEPFLWHDGHLITWNDARISQSLADGSLPIPTVTWDAAPLTLTTTAFVAGTPGSAVLYARYRVSNAPDAARDAALFVAIRPFQVLPPWQTLNMVGGVTAIHDLAADGRTVWVNHRTPVVSLTPPTQVGVTTFDEGQVGEMLLTGQVPSRRQVTDPIGYASGALQYDLHLPAGGSQEVFVAVPYSGSAHDLAAITPATAASHVAQALAATTAQWQQALGPVELDVPDAARDLVDTVKSTLAYILINRDGPAIQPGSRTYARSWIRDSAMTSAALLQMGIPGPVRELLPWYAGYQYPDGKIPCAIDHHGPDPLPEHDSNGQFLYCLAEYYRYTHDVGMVQRLWPNAVRAVDYIEQLRAQRLTPEYQQGDKQAFYGLLPESISHEGYAAHPVHSYWDDFYALRGLKDAVFLATVVDDAAQVQRAAALRDGLQRDLHASIRRVIDAKHLDFIPASADLGDFDPSSTSVAVVTAGEQARLPAAPLEHTFQAYYKELVGRRDGTVHWDAYAPYELRNAGVLVRLGHREQALEVLQLLMAGRRPAAWNAWAEVVWHDPAAPKFIGDMPHTWVGAGFVESVRSLFVYEREDDDALVLAAGIPRAWVERDGGTGGKRLPTRDGVLSFTVRADGPSRTRLQITGALEGPRGGLVLDPPLPAPLQRATVNGAPAELRDGHVVVRTLPAEVVLEH